MTDANALRQLLAGVADGQIEPERAFQQLKDLPFAAVDDFAKIDWHRRLRTGFPEVIWGPGKTAEQIAKIATAMRDRAPVVMATRIDPSVAADLVRLVPDFYYYDRARICAMQSAESLRQGPHPGQIGILSAGTADLAVAEEAAVTAELMGFRVDRLWDVGVAGLHRLLAHRDRLANANVLVVVAGMEGALPSVVAGLVDSPVIAVPTSIGYGSHLNGLTPLLAMLNSCATGIGVVNIDNGFGAAMLAGQILRVAHRLAAP